MIGHNPWIDLAVVGVCMLLVLTAWAVSVKCETKQKVALRGATRNITQ